MMLGWKNSLFVEFMDYYKKGFVAVVATYKKGQNPTK